MTQRVARLLLAVVVASSGSARAGTSETPAPGQRVRLTAPELADEPLVGRLTTVEQETVALRVSGRLEPVVVPRALVRKWEVSRGLKRNVGRGAFRGFLFGAAVGAGLGAWAYADGTYNNAAQPMAFGATFFGGIGAGIGALVGLSRSERWEELKPVRVGVFPVPGGIGLSVSLSFEGRR